MNQSMTEELANAPIGKLFWKLALPSVLAQLINLLYNVIDRMYLGHMKGSGSLALTGVGICFPIICLINAFSLLIGQGGAPRASMALGEKNKERAETILGNCFHMLLLTAVILTTLTWIFGEKLLWMFGASKDTIIYALPYMRIYSTGAVFVMISLGLNTFITAQGFTKYSMITVVTGAIINIILDPLLIFVLNLGTEGAAYATVFSQMVSAIIVLRFLLGKQTILKLKKDNLFLQMEIVGSVLSLGVSPFIMQATEAAISISFNYSLQKYGGDVAVGAMTIATTIMQMIFIPVNGIGQGAQPIISFNYGACNVERFREIIKKLVVTCLTVTLIAWMIVEMFPGIFIRIFGNNGEVYHTAIWALRLYVASAGVFGMQSAVQQTLVATGQAKESMFIACLRKVILLIPLIYILPLVFSDKVFAVFLAEPISDLISVSVATVIFIYKLPRLVKNMEMKKETGMIAH